MKKKANKKNYFSFSLDEPDVTFPKKQYVHS